jgi:hypothetical protein
MREAVSIGPPMKLEAGLWSFDLDQDFSAKSGR